jgi:hypothetical protein
VNWEAIGAVAEMIGSLAVLATLVYLAFQIRQASRIAKSTSTNQARAGVSDTLSAISGDTEAVNTYTKGMVDPDSLALHEKVRFDLIIFQTLRVTETAFYEYKEGLISAELWESQWRGERKILTTKGGRESWLRQRDLVSTTFMEWVNEHLPDP